MFLCSVGDSVHHLADASRHGAAKGVFVEVLDPAADPTTTGSSKRPWRDATSSSFVVGVERAGVMGPPVLAYETLAQAQAVAKRYGGQVKTWDEVRDTLFAAKGGVRAHGQ
jgi:nitrous oxide reductase accessory protein NosL